MNNQSEFETGKPAAGPKRGKLQEFLSAQAKMGGGPGVDRAEKEYTLVIFGLPRGGTTMVAGLAQRLGIAIGEDLGFNLEDPDFDRKPIPHMFRTIRRRNAKMAVWGWKFPAAGRYLPRLLKHIRNPRFVVVWRDPLTAAMRSIESIAEQGLEPDLASQKTLGAVELMIAMQQKNIEFLKQAGAPALLVSYEKAVRRPQEFVEQFAAFLGRELPKDMTEILAYMTPESYK
jgi:Sulfotransferase family